MKAALRKPYMTDGGRAVYVFSYYLNDHSSQKNHNGLNWAKDSKVRAEFTGNTMSEK